MNTEGTIKILKENELLGGLSPLPTALTSNGGHKNLNPPKPTQRMAQKNLQTKQHLTSSSQHWMYPTTTMRAASTEHAWSMSQQQTNIHTTLVLGGTMATHDISFLLSSIPRLRWRWRAQASLQWVNNRHSYEINCICICYDSHFRASMHIFVLAC